MRIIQLGVITLGVFVSALAQAKNDRVEVCGSIQNLFKPSNSISIGEQTIAVCFDTPPAKCHVPWTKDGSSYSYAPYDDTLKNVIRLAESYGCSFGGVNVDGGVEVQLSDTQKVCVAKALSQWEARLYEPAKLPLDEFKTKATLPEKDFAGFCADKLGTYHSEDKFSITAFFTALLELNMNGTGPIADKLEKVGEVLAKPVQSTLDAVQQKSNSGAAGAN